MGLHWGLGWGLLAQEEGWQPPGTGCLGEGLHQGSGSGLLAEDWRRLEQGMWLSWLHREPHG